MYVNKFVKKNKFPVQKIQGIYFTKYFTEFKAFQACFGKGSGE